MKNQIKKVILGSIIAILTLMAGKLLAGDLNSDAQVVKEAVPEVYAQIKESAIEEWDADYNMVIYTINNESDSYLDVYQFRGELYQP